MNATDETATPEKLEIAERRQQIFQRTIARYAARGIRIEDDAEYMALIKLWISGELEMREAAGLYDEIRKRRGRGNAVIAHPDVETAAAAPDANVSAMTQEQLIEELAKISDRL